MTHEIGINEARTHFHRHGRACLTDDARLAAHHEIAFASSILHGPSYGQVCVILGGIYSLGFKRTDAGTVAMYH